MGIAVMRLRVSILYIVRRLVCFVLLGRFDFSIFLKVKFFFFFFQLDLISSHRISTYLI